MLALAGVTARLLPLEQQGHTAQAELCAQLVVNNPEHLLQTFSGYIVAGWLKPAKHGSTPPKFIISLMHPETQQHLEASMRDAGPVRYASYAKVSCRTLPGCHAGACVQCDAPAVSGAAHQHVWRHKSGSSN